MRTILDANSDLANHTIELDVYLAHNGKRYVSIKIDDREAVRLLFDELHTAIKILNSSEAS